MNERAAVTWRTVVGLFIICLATILNEILLTRIFSVTSSLKLTDAPTAVTTPVPIFFATGILFPLGLFMGMAFPLGLKMSTGNFNALRRNTFASIWDITRALAPMLGAGAPEMLLGALTNGEVDSDG